MADGPSFWRVIGRGLLWAIGGAVLAPLLTLLVAVPLYYFNNACGTPGDSGGCEMGFAVMVITSPLIGAPAGFLFGVVRTMMRSAG
jgi:hypothetical protein